MSTTRGFSLRFGHSSGKVMIRVECGSGNVPHTLMSNSPPSTQNLNCNPNFNPTLQTGPSYKSQLEMALNMFINTLWPHLGSAPSLSKTIQVLNKLWQREQWTDFAYKLFLPHVNFARSSGSIHSTLFKLLMVEGLLFFDGPQRIPAPLQREQVQRDHRQPIHRNTSDLLKMP